MDKRLIRRVRELLKERECRLFLYELLRTCNTFSHGFVPGEPTATSFHAGQRSIGLYLFELILAAGPDAFVQMRREWNEEIKAQVAKETGKNTDIWQGKTGPEAL